jgi:hypothetical protein
MAGNLPNFCSMPVHALHTETCSTQRNLPFYPLCCYPPKNKTWWFHKLLTKLRAVPSCTHAQQQPGSVPNQQLQEIISSSKSVENVFLAIFLTFSDKCLKMTYIYGLTMELSTVNFPGFVFSKLSLLQLSNRVIALSNGIKLSYITTMRKIRI